VPRGRGQIFTLDAAVALLLALVAISAALSYVHIARPTTYSGQVQVSTTAVVQPVKWGWVATGSFRGELPHLEVKEVRITNWHRKGWFHPNVYYSAHVDIRVPPKKRIVTAFLVLMIGDNHVVEAFDAKDRDLGVFVTVNGVKCRVFPTVPIDWKGDVGWKRYNLYTTYNGRIWEKTVIDLTVDPWGNPLLAKRTDKDHISLDIKIRVRGSWGERYLNRTRVIMVLAPDCYDVAVRTWLPQGEQTGPCPANKNGNPVRGPIARNFDEANDGRHPVTNFADWYGQDLDDDPQNITIRDLINKIGPAPWKVSDAPDVIVDRRSWYYAWYLTAGTGDAQRADVNIDPRDPNGDGIDGILLRATGDRVGQDYRLFAAYVMMPRTFSSCVTADAPRLALTRDTSSFSAPPEFVVHAGFRDPTYVDSYFLSDPTKSLGGDCRSATPIRGRLYWPVWRPWYEVNIWNLTPDMLKKGKKYEASGECRVLEASDRWYMNYAGVPPDYPFGAAGYGHLVMIDPHARWSPDTNETVEDVLRTHNTLRAYLLIPNRGGGPHIYWWLNYYKDGHRNNPWMKFPGGFAVQGGPQPRLVTVWIRAPGWLFQWNPWTDGTRTTKFGFANTRFKNVPGGDRPDELELSFKISRPPGMPSYIRYWSVQDVYMFGNMDEDPDMFRLYIDGRQVWDDKWAPPVIEDLKALSGGEVATPGQHTVRIWEYEQPSPEAVEIGPYSVLVLYRGIFYVTVPTLQPTKRDAVEKARQMVTSILNYLGIRDQKFINENLRITVAPARGYGKPHQFKLVLKGPHPPDELRRMATRILSQMQSSGILSYIAMCEEHGRPFDTNAIKGYIESVLWGDVHYELYMDGRLILSGP